MRWYSSKEVLFARNIMLDAVKHDGHKQYNGCETLAFMLLYMDRGPGAQIDYEQTTKVLPGRFKVVSAPYVKTVASA
jgi:hypothetical protein